MWKDVMAHLSAQMVTKGAKLVNEFPVMYGVCDDMFKGS